MNVRKVTCAYFVESCLTFHCLFIIEVVRILSEINLNVFEKFVMLLFVIIRISYLECYDALVAVFVKYFVDKIFLSDFSGLYQQGVVGGSSVDGVVGAGRSG